MTKCKNTCANKFQVNDPFSRWPDMSFYLLLFLGIPSKPKLNLGSIGYCSIWFFGLSIKAKSNFQNGFTIESKSNHNPTIFGKRQQILNGQVLWCNHGIPKRHLISTYTLLINQFFENFEKSSLASLLEHNLLWNFNIIIK